jgi:hypothetical protein
MLNVWSRVRPLLKPQVVLPVLLTAALLVFAFSLGNLHQVIERVGRLPMHALWLALAAAAAYLACKAGQLKMLLAHLGLHIPARPFWLAFAVGELTVTLPLGMASQNWVLSASRRVHIGRSLAATVMMALAEFAVTFLFLAVVGIPGWPDARMVAVALLAAAALVFFLLLLFERKAGELAERLRRPWARQGAKSALETIRGLRRLSTPVIITISIALAAVYLGALTFAFWDVGRGVGVAHLDYITAVTIYLFSLAVILVGGGLFSQIGTVEVLGMLVAREWGIDYTNGLALMLGFRIVWTAAIWLLCLPIVGMMWREMPLRHRKDSAERGKEVSR